MDKKKKEKQNLSEILRKKALKEVEREIKEEGAKEYLECHTVTDKKTKDNAITKLLNIVEDVNFLNKFEILPDRIENGRGYCVYSYELDGDTVFAVHPPRQFCQVEIMVNPQNTLFFDVSDKEKSIKLFDGVEKWYEKQELSKSERTQGLHEKMINDFFAKLR